MTSDWISYALIDDITDAFGPLIQNIEYEVDSIDELVLILKEAEQSDMLRRYVSSIFYSMGLWTMSLTWVLFVCDPQNWNVSKESHGSLKAYGE